MPRLKRRVSRAPRVEALELRALLSSTAMSSAVSGALRVDADAYNPSQILVRYRTDGPVVGPLPLVLAGADLDWEVSAVPGLRQVELTPGWGVHEALAAYRADPRVLYAEPDFVVRAEAIPNDPRFNQQWGLDNTNVPFGGLPDADIDAPQAWDVTTGNPNTIVAVIDTGVDFNHPDLAANIWTNTREIAGNNLDDDVNGYVDDINGYDFVNNDGSPLDDNSHGTHVAGIIGASGNNAVGIAGVARDVRIMALKFLDASGSGYISAALSALNYAVANGATISNNSWGGGPYSQAMADAIRNAGDRGHIFVAAAGNSGSNIDTTPSYPASYNFANVVAVAATNVSDQLAGFSNFGPVGVHLGAPGQDILSTIPNGGYGFKSGTSMAAPMVSGVFALVRGQHPEWSNGQVISQVLSTVDPVPGLQGKVKNAGRVNAARAVGADIAGASVTTSTPTGTVNGPVGSVRLRFNEAINPSSFTTADVIDISGPAGALAATGVSPVAGSGNFEFDVTFAPQSAPGSYRLTVGPDILDLVGNRMDQDGDGINGEVPGDRYTAGFTIAVATGGGDGLAATYYDDKEFAGAVLNRIDPTVDFNWGNGSPDPSMGPDDYSARWTGQVLAQFDETYNFSTFSDDGVRLWVDGRLLIDNWTEHAPTENNGAIALLAGRKYAIRMEYFEGGGGAVARLRWSSPSTPKTAIPKTQLFSDSAPTQSTFNATGSPVVTGASQEFVTAASSEEATPSGLAAPGELSPAGFNVVTLPTEAIPSPLIGRAIDEVLALSDPADSRQASAMFASRADRWGRPGADQPVVVSEPLGMDIPWAWDLAVARKKRGASLWGGR